MDQYRTPLQDVTNLQRGDFQRETTESPEPQKEDVSEEEKDEVPAAAAVQVEGGGWRYDFTNLVIIWVIIHLVFTCAIHLFQRY
jgi:hypothetical protein